MAKHWHITQYGTVLEDFLSSLLNDPDLEIEARAFLHALQESGNALGMPFSRPLGNGIFELRPHTDEVQARLLYFFGTTEKGEPKAVITNTFIKKTRKTPPDQIALAKKRREELIAQERVNKSARRRPNDHRTYH